MLISFTSPYLKKFIKKDLGDPFDNLLEDEESFSEYKLQFPKESLRKAKENLVKGKQKVETYQRTIEIEFENINLESNTETPDISGRIIASKLSKAGTKLSKAKRKLYSQSQKLTREVFKGDPNSISEELQERIKETQELILIATGIERVINEVEKEGAPDIGQAIILNSSWLQASIARFSSNTESHEEFTNNLALLITRLGQYLLKPTLPDELRIATNYLRKSLLLIPTKGVVKKNQPGNLYCHILKRYKPKRVYGPYLYPNLKYSTWRKMVKATGRNGIGAGTIFWREYLQFYKQVKKTNNTLTYGG